MRTRCSSATTSRIISPLTVASPTTRRVCSRPSTPRWMSCTTILRRPRSSFSLKSCVGCRMGIVGSFGHSLCLGAFALRVFGLARQSLWLDEGASYAIASSSVWGILEQTFTVEPNPPLYYLALHAWMAVAGSSEFVLRFLSVAAGVALVPVLYRLS